MQMASSTNSHESIGVEAGLEGVILRQAPGRFLYCPTGIVVYNGPANKERQKFAGFTLHFLYDVNDVITCQRVCNSSSGSIFLDDIGQVFM